MAMNNRDRVGKAFDLLSEGLLDVVDEVMTRAYRTADWPAAWAREEAHRKGGTPRTYTKHDVQVQLSAITEQPRLVRRVVRDHAVGQSLTTVLVDGKRFAIASGEDPDTDRYVRDIGNVTREILDRLVDVGANLEITIDIQTTKPEGFDKADVRNISENARTLKSDPSSGFEKA